MRSKKSIFLINFEYFFFRMAMNVGLEIFKCRQLMTRKNITSILTISGSEKSKNLFFPATGKSEQAIIICAHFGNWEAAGQGITITSGIPLLSVMRPFDNPFGYYEKSSMEDVSLHPINKAIERISENIDGTKKEQSFCLEKNHRQSNISFHRLRQKWILA